MGELPTGPARAADLLDMMSRYQLRLEYRSILRGVWLRNDQDADFGVLSIAAGMLNEHAVLCGWSAAHIWGNPYRPKIAEPEIVAPIDGNKRYEGVCVRRVQIESDEIVDLDGVRCTSLARTGIDLGRFNLRDEAVAALDAMAGLLPTMLDEMRAELKRWENHWGIGKAITAMRLVDPLAESPWETRLRLILVDECLCGWDLQVEVMNGRYRLDIAWPKLKVAVEYDGAHHRTAEQHAKDLERWNRLRAEGWIVIPVTAVNIRANRAEFVAQVRAALLSRGWVCSDPGGFW
jgi:very-short-patch-repair endonuclease